MTRRRRLQVTGVHGETVASDRGDSEVNELLPPADDRLNQHFSGTAAAGGKASDLGAVVVPNARERYLLTLLNNGVEIMGANVLFQGALWDMLGRLVQS